MDNKKLGAIIVLLSIALGAVGLGVINKYSTASNSMGCMAAPGCSSVGSVLNYTHLVVGILMSLISLGIYMVVFHKDSEAVILRRFEEEKLRMLNKDRFNILMKTLDNNEQKVLSTLREKEGISQHMVTLKTGLSKSKVSLILSNFERKNLVKREVNGKTYSVYLLE